MLRKFVVYEGDYQDHYIPNINQLENANPAGYYNHRFDAFQHIWNNGGRYSDIVLVQDFILQSGDLVLINKGSGNNIMAEQEYQEFSGISDTVHWNNIVGRPLTFPPASHQHNFSDINNVPDFIIRTQLDNAIQGANNYTDNAISDAKLNTQFWLPAVSLFDELPVPPSIDRTYLCRVNSVNNVYQHVPGDEWRLYSENTDFVTNEELAESLKNTVGDINNVLQTILDGGS